MRVKFGNGTKDVPVTEVTAENYLVPKGEEGSFHVKQEIPFFDQRTGKRRSVPRIQKYGAKEFQMIRRNLMQQGYDIVVLHDPTEWLKAEAEKKAEQEALTAQQKHELRKKQMAEQKEALKAEILAELREAGLLKEQKKEPAKTQKK